MNEEIIQQMQEEETPMMTFEVGGCRYTVGIHFNMDAKETMEDKIRRMIGRDTLESTNLDD